jgi:hypothetical protein
MNNMTPEQIQAILAAGGDDPEAAGLQRQQAMADTMRQRAVGGTGPDKMAGGLVVPNWAQAAGNFGQGMMAQKQQPGIDAGMQRVGQRNVDARKQYLDILMQGLRSRQPAPMQMSESAMGPGGPANY